MKYNMVIGIGPSGKAVSSATGGAFNPKKTVSFFDLKDAFRIGRSALDALAASAGIPLGQMRQMYRNGGIDPDKFDTTLTTAWQYDFENGSWASKSEGAFNEDMWNAETVSKGMPANWILVGLVALIFLLGMRR